MGLRQSDAGVIVSIRLQPGAGANRIDGVEEMADGRRRLRVRVTAAPEKGKANKAMIKLLAKQWKWPAGSLQVVGGRSSRDKTIAVAGEPAALMAHLTGLYPGFLGKKESSG
jgi:hypothetical protein